MRNASSVVLLWFVISVWVAATAHGQESSQEPIGGLGFIDEVEVTVVNIDVFVRDRGGEPVTGLTGGDFRLLQNGQEVPISNFAVVTKEYIRSELQPLATEQTTVDPSAVLPPELRPVYVAFFVDNENLRPLDRNRVLRQVRSFVLENLEPPVQMMVISYQRSLDVVQDFTTDASEVNGALRSLVRMSGGRTTSDNERKAILEDLQEAAAGTGGREGRSGPMQIRQRIYQYAEEEANNLTFALSAMRQVMAMMSGLDGRKSIIHVSSGLPMTPGWGLMQEYAATFKDNSVMAHRSAVDKTRSFQELVSVANAQEISIYAIDAEGLDTLGGGSAEMAYDRDPVAAASGSKNFKDSLRYMAERTGGIAIVNTNDVSFGMQRVAADLFNFYSLGFRLSSENRDRVHRVEVQLPEHPEYELRYRRRFVERSRQSRVQDRVLSSLMVDIDDNPMRLALDTGEATPLSNDRWQVPVHLSFPLDSVALLEVGEDYVGRVVLFVGAQDLKGRRSEIQRQEHEVRVAAADYQRALQQRFAIDFSLLLEEGQQRIAIGLYDEITRRASYERTVVAVP